MEFTKIINPDMFVLWLELESKRLLPILVIEESRGWEVQCSDQAESAVVHAFWLLCGFCLFSGAGVTVCWCKLLCADFATRHINYVSTPHHRTPHLNFFEWKQWMFTKSIITILKTEKYKYDSHHRTPHLKTVLILLPKNKTL